LAAGFDVVATVGSVVTPDPAAIGVLREGLENTAVGAEVADDVTIGTVVGAAVGLPAFLAAAAAFAAFAA